MSIRPEARSNRRWIPALVALAALQASDAFGAGMSLQTASTVGGSQPQAQDIQNYGTPIGGNEAGPRSLHSGASSALGIATATLVAAMGDVHAVSNGSVVDTANAFANASNQAILIDVLHVTSPTLPNGTPVTLNLSMTIGVQYAVSVPTAGLNVGINSTLTVSDSLTSVLLHSDGPQTVLDAGLTVGQGIDVQTATLQTSVGANVTLDQRLLVNAHAEPGAGGVGRRAKVDMSQGGARFFVDAGPDVVLVSDSTHDYSTSAVPEPSGWVALGMGSLLVGHVARRRSRVGRADG